MNDVNIVIVDYPSASKSSVYGLVEVISLADTICQKLDCQIRIFTKVIDLDDMDRAEESNVVILPPSINDEFYTQKCTSLDDYLCTMQKKGAILASACVGSFILASGGFLDGKFCTTHWRLANQFKSSFPKAKLNTNSIIVNEGNIITAGGRMAWIDLAIEILLIFCPPTVVSLLSKDLVIDIGHREQKYYRQFLPRQDHGDELTLNVQHYLDEKYPMQINILELADKFYVSARTLQRRFHKSLEMSVTEYLQKTRLQKACQHIELTNKSISEIAYAVGYQNVNAFRKIFTREYGLTPSDYRKRFGI